MSDCNRLSDRMPLVGLGRAEWSSEEVLHLNGCRSCQEEWTLVRLASRMGEATLPVLDTAATSHAVIGRLERARLKRRRWQAWSFVGLAAAAALVAMIWAERPVPPAGVPAPVAGLQIPLPELDSLQPAELDSVLQAMDEPLVDGSTLDAPSLGDLDAAELQSVLDYWEG
jgi:hypothetical protein